MGSAAYAKDAQTAVANLQYGGEMGWAPDLSQWVNNQQYIRKQLMCLLIEAPTAFSNMADSDYWIGTLRSLFELHPLRITGLNMGLEVETVETPVGGGGQMQEDFTDVKEQRSQITFSWNEKYGMPVYRFLSGWIRNLMMDPNSKFASINTLTDATAVTDLMADQYSATCAFIEPDPTHTYVVKSWLVTNMWPKGTGDVIGQKDPTAAGEPANYDVQFAGIAQFGAGVDAFCQTLMDNISISGANPYNRPAFVSGIAADVAAQTTGSYASQVSDLAANAVS
jgi:hypothetical protein